MRHYTVLTNSMPQSYDVIVVGSGAGGATAALVLVNAGARVLMLEAGRMLTPSRDFLSHDMPWDLRFRGEGPPGKYDGLWKINEYTAHLYTNPREESYDSLDRFHWTRLRAVGGRTNTWGRSCFRHGPLDFKPATRQGYGDDWPIDYDELAPYYDKVERLVGLAGESDRYKNMPDGVYAGPPHPWRSTERDLKAACDRIGVPVLSERTAALSVPHDGRPKCHYCSGCGRGCPVGARFSTLDAIVPKLQGRTNFTLRTNAIAREVIADDRGRAKGVAFLDARTGKEEEVHARALVLAASTVETGRLLLNSRSRHHPAGLANSSGRLGQHLMDTIKSGPMVGILPSWRNRRRVNDDGAGGSHVTIPRFNYGRANGYHGGYFILVGTGFGRGATAIQGIPGYGASLKDEIYSRYGSVLSLRGYGECLSRRENGFEIDPSRVDGRGIPQVRFTCGHGDNERRMMEDMYGWMEQILRACGAEILPYQKRLEPLGDATHECGTTRMGLDPATSVLNRWGQAHDVPNLFITDASGFVTSPGTHGITTWIMALAWRASEYLAEGLRTGDIA